MEVASQTVGSVVKTLMGYITKHLGYITSSTRYVEHMKNRMDHLEDKSSEINRHKDANDRSNKEIPPRVPGWLDDVEKINEDVKSISSNWDKGCFSVKGRHQAAVKAIKATKRIDDLITEDLFWSDAPKPLGRIDSKPAIMSTTSTLPPCTESGFKFKSRDGTFNDALKLLQHDDKTQVIALCGMGGVGKTTMMNQLKSVAANKKMFKWIVMVVVGGNPDLKSIQHVVAVHTGEALTETNETLRAEYLHKRFEKISECKENTLVILDDVWSKVELKDIGLSPLPNGVKLLLTSRDASICRQIAVDVNSVFHVVDVKVLKDVEALDFFCELTGVSELEQDLHKIGGDIVKKCGGLPLAIKLIAPTLKSQGLSVWKDTLRRLRKKNLTEVVQKAIKISYTNIKEIEEKEVFRLCGMFPEDSYIPIEDLTRYAWGLKLLQDVSTLEDARDRTKTCVRSLIDANLLMDGDNDHREFVKMHDLVLLFVVDSVSKGENAWIIDHSDMSKWSEFRMSTSCKQMSLACKGGSKFPQDFKFPNLSVLKLMQGDESLRFPNDFYGEMKNLQVIAYNQMKYPLLPTSFQCSVNLQTLCLHDCVLTFDLSCIGNLSNLEVLSFARSRIRKLPSTFKNLRKLRLLDLTLCRNLVIADGVLENLDSLEELYMEVSYGTAISFTDDQWKELSKLSRKLSALDIEFFENKSQLQNMSFKKLERFRISVGRRLGNMTSYENTLELVMKTSELCKSRLNELFVKTNVLVLEVDDLNNFADVKIESSHPSLEYSPFYNLRKLVIQNCKGLEYLFTINVAMALPRLEILAIFSCHMMERIIHIESNGGQKITFPRLKMLNLYNLPKLSCLCNKANVIELPQLVDLKLDKLPYFTSIYPKNQLATSSKSTMRPLLNEEIVILKLERMSICNMENLKEIWPCEQVNVSTLLEIRVRECNSLVNLFPCNPMPLLQHLEELQVMTCGAIEVIFNINMDCVQEVECNSRLRRIKAHDLIQLREIWKVKGVNNANTVSWFQAIETIEITDCKSFRNIITPTTSSFNMRMLRNLVISYPGESGRSNELFRSDQAQKISVTSKEEIHELCDISLNLMHNFHHHLHELRLMNYNEVEVVFDIESPSSRELVTTHQLFPRLEDLTLHGMERMSHVWKCTNWNEFLILQKQHPLASFHNLTTISISFCHNIKCLFSPLMAKLLSNLKKVSISFCDGIEEVVSSKDGEDDGEILLTSTSNQRKFLLDYLDLEDLKNLKHIGDGGAKCGSKFVQMGVVPWSICKYSKEITIKRCHALSILIPSYAARQMHKLEKLKIDTCESLKEVFETQGVMSSGDVSSSSINVDDGNDGTPPLSRLKTTNLPQLSNLREIQIERCDLLEYVFSFSTLKSLRQLEKLTIRWCKAMKEIVKHENGEQTTATEVIEFPCLKCVILWDLPKLLGLFLGKNDFVWKSLEEVEILRCPRIEMFTSGHSTAKHLKFIKKGRDIYSLDCGLNFRQDPSPWSYHNLVKRDLNFDYDIIKVIPSNELQHVKKLESIQLGNCFKVEEIFEVAMEGRNLNKAVEIPNLREVELLGLRNLKYLWKNNQGRVLEFPNLTRLQIDACDGLKHAFTSSMLGCLLQLQDLLISRSKNIEVIVKEEEECDGGVKSIELPHLKSLTLDSLNCLKGFCLGDEEFSFLSMNYFKVLKCPELTVFTMGHTTTPELRRIDTGNDMYYLQEDLNSFVTTKLQEGLKF